jgi:hypothetical protein
VENKYSVAGGLTALILSGIAYYHREKIINYFKKKL